MAIRIGISGWQYDGWRGDFYPEGLPKRAQLSYAAQRFETIELNGSFYSLQTPGSYGRWYDSTPHGFRFAVKGSRFITHMKRLGDSRTALANFFASGVLRLDEKLGPLLWQLPANFRFERERLEGFFDLLPKTFEQAAALGRHHDDRLKARAWLRFDTNRRIRHALEFRHESFLTEEYVALARRHGVATAVSDSPDWPCTEEVTAGFVYVRLHGSDQLYASRYSDGQLDDLRRKASRWAQGGEPRGVRKITRKPPPPRKTRDVYVYFDNDQKVHAPKDAMRLRERL